MTVAELMTPMPESLGPDASIQKAAQLMRDHDYGVLPVVDDIGSLVGIVTDRDIVVQAIARGHGLDTPLRECMTTSPDTISQDMPVEQALRLMSKHQIRRIPVMENGRLIGMLSMSDVAKSQVPEQEKSSVLENVSATGGDLRTGAGLPES